MTVDNFALAASLSVMWKGMLGIFAVMALITLVVVLFSKLGK